ncbi:MAG TPA: ParA family protein [Myxococcota bacterium]|nr:ParA family protein [Myxococcota bacterium]
MPILDAVSERVPPSPARAHAPRVLAVASNKGGVGKTTVATNLAIYVRALREDLPVLIVGLDDQGSLDRMFTLRPPVPGGGNLKHAWAERSFDRVIQLGQYGVHFVASPPDLASLKARADDPGTLLRIIERTQWGGLIVLDTKSDLEALTLNALHAADRIVLPVADWASLEEAGKVYAILERSDRAARARILLTLVDARTHVDDPRQDLRAVLEAEIARRGWARYASYLSRSPRVEALNSGHGRPLSILHHAQGTIVHRQMRAFADEVLVDLGLGGVGGPRREEPAEEFPLDRLGSVGGWKTALLRGLRGR